MIIESTYRCLLADVSRLSGFSEIRGSRFDLYWCLNEAPELEKHVLEHIETGSDIDLDRFPTQLHRLVVASVSDAIMLRLLRQLLLFCYKAYVQPTNDTVNKAISSFTSTNAEVREFGNGFNKSLPRLLDLARKHVQSVIYELPVRDIVPFHGPGSSTTPKERWMKWYESIEYLYPYSDYFSCYFNSDHCAEFGALTSEYITAKLIPVPKDSRGPRLICVHPAEAIWIQQGLRTVLERAISRRRHQRGPWPRGRIHFDDQTVNGRLALRSSLSRKYATLDMKEASDRISDILVQYLFGDKYKYFGCCRAQKFVLPSSCNLHVDDDNIYSYAPMGNATTFPVESLVFWAICCASIQSRRVHHPNSVFVFGDDILVPSDEAQAVMLDLQSFGLLPNTRKCFWKSHFRESCGVDAFNGVNVTPVRWKCRPDAGYLSELQPLCDVAMRLRMAHYSEAATELYSYIRRKLKQHTKRDLFLTRNYQHGSIAEYVELDSLAWRDAYWHRDIQDYVSPIWQLQERNKTTPLSGWNHVLESLTSLTRTGHSMVPDRSLSRAMRFSRGWVHMYPSPSR